MVSAHAFEGFEKVTYHILFPALIVGTLAKADLMAGLLGWMGFVMVLSILAIAGLLIGLRPALRGIEGPAFASLFQGAVRWNSFVALALAISFYGQLGLTLASVAVIAMVPLLNVMTVFVHARYAASSKPSPREIMRAILVNPLIWSSLLGAGLNIGQVPMPTSVMTSLDIIGKAALGAGLLVVGAGLDLKRIGQPGLVHVLAIGLKLVALPALSLGLATAFGVTGPALGVLVICMSVPTASGSYVLAKELNGDAPVMAEILTLQTIAALISMPIWLLTIIG